MRKRRKTYPPMTDLEIMAALSAASVAVLGSYRSPDPFKVNFKVVKTLEKIHSVLFDRICPPRP